LNPSHLPASPYKGLAAFEASDLDALFFFGRERDSQIIAANLIASSLTVLFGPTGVGKTSVLRAGVAYQLRREAGVDVVIHSSWTGPPSDALSRAAAGSAADVYLILDQFEEFFLYHQHDHPFVEELAQLVGRASPRVNVLIGIREEALAQLDSFKAVIPTLLSNRLRLQRLDRTAGRSAILGPVHRYNELAAGERQVEVEPELVTAVLDEVAAGRVALGTSGRGVVTGRSETPEIEAPYLQLVMARIWEVETESGSDILRRETLRELGGATQIVQDHLEHAMDELTPRQKDAAAAMYRFLVTPSGTKIAHGVSDLAGYADIDEEDARAVLRLLADERIVRANTENGTATRYEIYHDVLADAVVAWRSRHGSEQALREAERRRRRALFVASAALIGLLLFGAIAIYAIVERSHSRSQAQRAHARELAAAATSNLDVDPQRSIRLAVQAADLEPGAREEEVLRDSLLQAQQRAVMRAGGPVRVAGFDRSGRHVITGSKDGKVRVYRVGATSPERILDQHGPVTAAAYSANGSLILTAGRDGMARIWGSGPTPLYRLSAGGPITTAFFAGNDRLVLALTRNGLIRLWRVREGRLLQTIRVRGKAVPKGGAVSPTGRLLVTYAQDRFARVYSLVTGLLVNRLEHRGLVHCVSFSPNGSLFVTCGHEGVARVWSTASGKQVKVLRGPQVNSPILDGAFSPNGILVAGAVADGTARVWEARTGLQIGLGIAHANPATAVAFDPTGNAVATGGMDNRARTWLKNGKLEAILAGHRGAINMVEFSPDGRSLVTASEDGTARLWSSGTAPELALLARQTPISAFALSSDGRRVIAGDTRGVARVRAIGRRRVSLTKRVRGAITSVAFGPRGPLVARQPTLSIAVSADRELVALGNRDGSLVVRSSLGVRKHVFRAGRAAVTAVAFSPDGVLLASGADSGVVRLWNLRTGRQQRIASHHLGVTSLAFSPDGKLLLSASRDGDARLWDVAERRTLYILDWHFGPLGGASFSPDGRWIVTAGPSAAAVGSVATGRRVLLLNAGRTRPLVGAAFGGRDGRVIVTASRDGTIRTYRCDVCGGIDELVALAKRRLISP
jgi:WD40 repeat protein